MEIHMDSSSIGKVKKYKEAHDTAFTAVVEIIVSSTIEVVFLDILRFTMSSFFALLSC